MESMYILSILLMFFLSCRSDGDPGRDPCKTTENGFGLICSNITSEFFTSPMFFSLDDDIARFTGEMKRLEILNSNITHLRRGSFKQMPHLSYLVVSNVSLREIESGAFEGLTNLKMADLSNNILQNIPVDAFRGTRISHIDLEGNLHLQIPTNGAILTAKRLRSLILKKCNLHHLPGSAFTQLLSLTYLDLSDNHLQMLPREVFLPLRQINYLDLSRNNFRTIDFAVFTSIPSYPNNPGTVILAENLWNCDCKIAGLIRWVMKSDRNSDGWTNLIKLKKRTVCHEPTELKGLSWNDPKINKFVAMC